MALPKYKKGDKLVHNGNGRDMVVLGKLPKLSLQGTIKYAVILVPKDNRFGVQYVELGESYLDKIRSAMLSHLDLPVYTFYPNTKIRLARELD